MIYYYIVHINDNIIVIGINCNIRLIADDTSVYMTVENLEFVVRFKILT